MGSRKVQKQSPIQRQRVGVFAAVIFAVLPGIGGAEIIWSGNYATGDFSQWHKYDDADVVTFWQVPEYGRPIQYGHQSADHVGNGDLLSLVAATERTVDGIYYPKGPTRGGPFSAKFTVKNSADGAEPKDCDNDVCRRRRSELTAQATLPRFYDAMDYLDENWISVSHFLPADWDDAGSGSGVQVFTIKPTQDGGGIGACIGIEAVGGHWEVEHSWTDIKDFRDQIPFQQAPKYSPTFPASGSDSGDLLGDFPDVTASRAALENLNKGGWTDWVLHVIFDARSADDGGRGLFELWKRAGSGPWVKVLKIVPKEVTVSGLTYDRGVCYNSPGGFGIKAGMYMSKSQVWGLDESRVIYNANIKVGDANTKFSEMSHDGSSPGSVIVADEKAPPRPPQIVHD